MKTDKEELLFSDVYDEMKFRGNNNQSNLYFCLQMDPEKLLRG